MKRKSLEQKLKALGWSLIRHGRKHDIWTKDEDEIIVPRHSEINEYTAKAILKMTKGDE